MTKKGGAIISALEWFLIVCKQEEESRNLWSKALVYYAMDHAVCPGSCCAKAGRKSCADLGHSYNQRWGSKLSGAARRLA